MSELEIQLNNGRTIRFKVENAKVGELKERLTKELLGKGDWLLLGGDVEKVIVNKNHICGITFK